MLTGCTTLHVWHFSICIVVIHVDAIDQKQQVSVLSLCLVAIAVVGKSKGYCLTFFDICMQVLLSLVKGKVDPLGRYVYISS
jgi:hypothetical protein